MQSREDQNKALVLDAFDTLFNKKDHATAESCKMTRRP
jgi:hypothetical protein